MSVPSIDQVVRLEAGLDALDSRQDARPSWTERVRAAVLPPVVAVVALLVAWAALAASGLRPPGLLPSPADVAHTLSAAWRDGTLPSATAASLGRAAVGFGLSVALGTVLGLVLARGRRLRAAVGPLVSGLQSLPAATWLPAAVLWFGLGDAALYAVVLCGAVPSIALGLLSGIDRVPPTFLRVGQVLGAGPVASLWHVVIPAALPGYVAGLRLGWAFAWRSLMTAELVLAAAGPGSSLGLLLDVGRRAADMSLVLAVVVVILVIGVAVEAGILGPVERRLLRSRGLGAS